MANLPLTGSQYWGAALNNYLRQMNTDIEDLKIQLANFTVAAAYSGSGWTESTYSLDLYSDMPLVDGNSGVYIVTDKSKARITGTLIFSGSTGATPVTLESASNVSMSFDTSHNSDTNCRVVNKLQYSESEKTYSVQTRTETLEVACPKKGFYPIYAVNDINTGFKLALNPNQEFVFSENYVLMGILERSDTDFRFIKKTDSAFKNLYTTRKDNLTSFATIVNPNGLFTPSESGLKINLYSLVVDYQSNGISERADDASTGGSPGITSDYKIPNDYKRFHNIGHQRRAFRITYVDKGESIEEEWVAISTANDVLLSSIKIDEQFVFDDQHVYGIYISVSGDLFIEQSAQAHNDLESLRAFAASAAWNLNANSKFRAAGLVLLGACYYDSDLHDWCALQAASNGISPEFLTNRYTENAEVIRWPSAVYSTNMKEKGSGDTFAQYKYEVYIPDNTVSTTTSYIKMLTNYDGTDLSGKNYFELPVAPDNYYNYKCNGEVFNGLGIGAMTINNSESEDSVVVDGSGQMFSKVKFVSGDPGQVDKAKSTNTEQYNSSTSILCNTWLLGNTAFESDANVTLPGKILNLKNITAHDDKGLIIDGNGKDITVVGAIAASDTTKKLTLKAADELTIQTTTDDGVLKLVSNKPIQCNNSITFTSDRRCKHNIQSLDMDTCVRAVRDLDAKSFTYNDSNVDTLGLIAQDIEKLLPEYKDLLVHCVQEGDLHDKRMVSETKLLFILWQAVRSLLKED